MDCSSYAAAKTCSTAKQAVESEAIGAGVNDAIAGSRHVQTRKCVIDYLSSRTFSGLTYGGRSSPAGAEVFFGMGVSMWVRTEIRSR